MIAHWLFGKAKQDESSKKIDAMASAAADPALALNVETKNNDTTESDDQLFQTVEETLEPKISNIKNKITFSVEDLGDAQITAQNARAVENLDHAVKREAISIAKDILNNLKIKCASMSIKELVDSGDIPLMDEVLEGMASVNGIFDHHLKLALKLDPELVKEKEMKEAIEALGIFQYQTMLKAADKAMIKAVMAEQRGQSEHAAILRAQAMSMRADITAMPPEYKHSASAKVGDLIAKVEKGIDRVVERMQQMTQSMMGSDVSGVGRDRMGASREMSQRQEMGSQQVWLEGNAGQQAQHQQMQQQIAINAAKAIQEARAARQATRNSARQQNNSKTPIAPQRISPPAGGVGGDATANAQPANAPPPVTGMMGANQPQDAAATPNPIRRNSQRSNIAAVGTNKVRVTAPKVVPPVVAPVTQPAAPTQSSAFDSMLDPSMLSSMQGRMSSVAGLKTSDALAPNSAARTIAALKNEQDEQRLAASKIKTAEKTRQAQTEHEHQEQEQAAKRKAEQEKAALASPGGAIRKPTITR